MSAGGPLVDEVDAGCLDLVARVGNWGVVACVGGDSRGWGKGGEEGQFAEDLEELLVGGEKEVLVWWIDWLTVCADDG